MVKIEQVGLDVHCGVVGNIQAFHVCAPGSIPGNGIFSQWPLWVKSRKVLHVKSCLCRLWSCDLVRLGKASSSSYIGIVSRIVILSYLKLRDVVIGMLEWSSIKRHGSYVKSHIFCHQCQLGICG